MREIKFSIHLVISVLLTLFLIPFISFTTSFFSTAIADGNDIAYYAAGIPLALFLSLIFNSILYLVTPYKLAYVLVGVFLALFVQIPSIFMSLDGGYDYLPGYRYQDLPFILIQSVVYFGIAWLLYIKGQKT